MGFGDHNLRHNAEKGPELARAVQIGDSYHDESAACDNIIVGRGNDSYIFLRAIDDLVVGAAEFGRDAVESAIRKGSWYLNAHSYDVELKRQSNGVSFYPNSNWLGSPSAHVPQAALKRILSYVGRTRLVVPFGDPMGPLDLSCDMVLGGGDYMQIRYSQGATQHLWAEFGRLWEVFQQQKELFGAHFEKDGQYIKDLADTFISARQTGAGVTVTGPDYIMRGGEL